MHPKLVFQTLTDHRLPVFLGFRSFMTVHTANLPSHFALLEAKALHPSVHGRHPLTAWQEVGSHQEVVPWCRVHQPTLLVSPPTMQGAPFHEDTSTQAQQLSAESLFKFCFGRRTMLLASSGWRSRGGGSEVFDDCCEAQSWVLVNHVFCRLSPNSA
jgi:hypothetical protein